MPILLAGIGALYCAYRVMRAERLLHVSLWLATASALVSVVLYLIGAPEVAVIELSVGAGLVTVLFVFAFSITGEITLDDLTLIPRPLVWLLAGGAVGLLAWYTLPAAPGAAPVQAEQGMTFNRMLWEVRGLDVVAQAALIFAGVMGLMGLLSEGWSPRKPGAPDRVVMTVDSEAMMAVGASDDGPSQEVEAVISAAEEARR